MTRPEATDIKKKSEIYKSKIPMSVLHPVRLSDFEKCNLRSGHLM